MKKINLITKVEVNNSLKSVVKAVESFFEKNKVYEYTLTIVSKINISEEVLKKLPTFVKMEICKQEENLETIITNKILNTTKDYAIVVAFNDENWEAKLSKIINHLEEGVDVCKVSKIYSTKNIFLIMYNFLIKLYYAFLVLCSNKYIDRIDYTDLNFQGFNQKAIYLMKNMKEDAYKYRISNCFILLKQKVLFMKKNNISKKIEHLEKNKITKTQKYSFVAFIVGVVLILLSLIFLLNIYVINSQIPKFIILVLMIFILTFGFGTYNYFYEESSKYKF